MSLILFRRPDPTSVRPFAALYIAFFILTLITINTYYLVFFEVHYRYILWSFLALGYLVSIYTNVRYRPWLDVFVNIMALVFFAIYFRMIIGNPTNFGSILGQLLVIFMVLRSYILFTRDDFFIPLIVSLTVMLLCSIPSYESNFVISLQAYFFAIVICLYLMSRAKDNETSRLGYFDRQTYRKSYKPGQQIKIIFMFSMIALLLATTAYLLIPHQQGPRRRYVSQLRNLFGRDIDDLPQQDDSSRPAPVDPLNERNSGTYVGFNENSFEITSGTVIREGTSATDIVMEVQMDYPKYMRAMIWDVYEDGEWKRSEYLNNDYEINPAGEAFQSIFHLDDLRAITVEELQDNRVEYDGIVYLVKRSIRSSYLFLPWQTTHVDIDLDELYFNQDWEVKLSGYGITPKVYIHSLENVRAYRFKAKTYLPSGMESAYLKDKTSGNFLERYTQLPDSVFTEINGRTVENLALEIVDDANAATDYEKTQAIFKYLKSIGKYSLDIPYCPPEYDLIPYFLLEVDPKRGHCEIFSSSLAIMLRSLDIPCRMVTGYSPGNYAFNRNRYVIQEKHAHAWVEVYFPEIGWIEFDPTPNSLWNDARDYMDNMVASASNVINELYVYSPEQFYRNRIRPYIRNTISLYHYNSARLSDRLSASIDIYNLVNIIIIVVMAAAVLAIVLIINNRKRTVSNYQRLSVGYYRNLTDVFRKKGMAVKSGETPSELLTNVSRKYPTLEEPLDNFLKDFWTINYAPEDEHSLAAKKIGTSYREILRQTRKKESVKNNSSSS